jgi:hypothetical protein
MKLTTLNQVKNKVFYYTFTLVTHPIFLLLIITIIYILLFVYFFADTVLCQGLDALANAQASSEELSSASQERISELKESIGRYALQGNKCKADYDR